MKAHPVFIRAKAKAAELGSSAKTISGVLKFLKEHGRKPGAARRPLQSTFINELSAWHLENRVRNWKNTVANRKADPEFKRSLDDRAFGLKFAGQLFRDIKKDYRAILAGKPADAYKFVDGLEDRLARINEIRKAHQLKPARFAHRLCLVPLLSITAEEAGVKLVKRGKDWEVLPTLGYDRYFHQDGYTHWKNDMPRDYTRAVNQNFVRSFAGIRSAQEIVYFLSDETYHVTLPEGYHWDSDDNGLKAVKSDSLKDDFHPLADKLILENAAQRIVADIQHNRDLRLAAAAREAAALAEMEGVYVCVADSRRAGNCDAGSISFARRHGLDPARHYAAKELVGIANGDAGRVRLAITAAVQRHRKDLERGYSILADHK